MIDPIAIGETKEFICKAELEVVAVEEVKDENGDVIIGAIAARKASIDPTVWIIGAIDSIEKAHIMNKMNLDGKAEVTASNTTSMLIEAVRYGLKGFKNFGTLKFITETVKFMDKEREIVHEDIIRAIPINILTEIAMQIWGENLVDEEAEKN